MTVEGIRAQMAQVEKEVCHCIRCGECMGSGSIRVDCDGWPEWDLETCETCGGDGVAELCDRCILLRDLDYDLMALEAAG